MQDRIVTTKYGRLRGMEGRDKKITVFRGVPYAQPPVGDLRWREPRPAVPWYGIREANSFGGICPQKSGQFMETMPIEDYYCSEDCLYLNVFVPENAEKCPVFVWFHGGGFQGGHGSDLTFDAEEFARQGIITVTVNYRLGIMGFLAHPQMRTESPYGTAGNFGVLDQVASLQWVHENIAAFGGDTENVTIGGQSAGGGSVCNMITTPLAKGLFVRAVIESGDRSMKGAYTPFPDQEKIGTELAEKLGDGSLDSLRKLPLEQIVRMDFDAAISYTGKSCSPWIDGVVLPREQYESLRSESGNNVPMLIGSNLDEGGPWGRFKGTYEDAVLAIGEDPKEVSKLYPEGTTPEETAARLTEIGSTRWKLRLAALAEKRERDLGLDTWHYQFCYRTVVDGVEHKAIHSSELIYVFGSLDAFPDEIKQNLEKMVNPELVQTVSRYWGNFLHSGNPNGEGLPYWASKREIPDEHMRLDSVCAMEADIIEEREKIFVPVIRSAYEL